MKNLTLSLLCIFTIVICSTDLSAHCPSDCSFFSNTYIGNQAGQSNTTGNENTFIGNKAGESNTIGQANTFVGNSAGVASTGFFNTFIGDKCGQSNSTGTANVFLGQNSGGANMAGSENTYLGISSGYVIEGDNNICIGKQSGPAFSATPIALSERLFIDVQGTNTRLIYGEFDNNIVRIHGEFHTSGNTGIGTTSPNSRLHVDASLGQNPFIAAIDGQTKFHISSNGGVSIGTPSAPPGNGLSVSGNVGIGETLPIQKLTVIGDASITGALVAPSDRRLKENVKAIDNALEIIHQLQPRTYVHQENKAKEFGLSDDIQYGLIAQELEKVLPSLVTAQAIKDEDGVSYKGVEYTQLIPILISGLKEMNAKNQVLESQYDIVLERLNELEKSMAVVAK